MYQLNSIPNSWYFDKLCPHGEPEDEHCGTCCVDIGDAERSMRFDRPQELSTPDRAEPSGSPQTAADQPLDSFLADAGLAFDDIPIAMAIHHRALAAARRESLDVDAALLRYGRHEEGCPDYFTEPPWQSCHCGWTDVIARLSSIPAREEDSDD